MLKFISPVIAAAALSSFSAQAAEPEDPDSELWSLADQYYGDAEMDAARRAVLHEGGAQTNWFIQADRFEYRSNSGDPLLLWDAQGWYGKDAHKFWVKTEGEYNFNADGFEEAELQGLYSKPITSYFDLQAGVRHDFAPSDGRTFGVIGLQGLAPYLFELDTALFVSGQGDVSARIEAEYELLLTQRLVLQPRAELNLAVQSVPEYGVGSGLSTAELGARLRYEVKREFAPYIGIDWTRSVGETADFARADGEDPSAVSFVAGLRLWF